MTLGGSTLKTAAPCRGTPSRCIRTALTTGHPDRSAEPDRSGAAAADGAHGDGRASAGADQRRRRQTSYPGALTIASGAVTNAGSWQAQNILLNARSLTNSGAVQSADALQMTLADTLTGTAGSRITALGAATLQAATLANRVSGRRKPDADGRHAQQQRRHQRREWPDPQPDRRGQPAVWRHPAVRRGAERHGGLRHQRRQNAGARSASPPGRSPTTDVCRAITARRWPSAGR